MAKISLSKITPEKSMAQKVITINGEEVIVEQYLPIEEKVALVEKVLGYVFDASGMESPIRTEIYFNLEMIRAYTNISITDKMMENAGKTYDLLEVNNIIDTVIEAIPETEYQNVLNYVEGIISRIVTFNYSFVGSMKALLKDYNTADTDVQALVEQLKDVENSEILKHVIQQLN